MRFLIKLIAPIVATAVFISGPAHADNPPPAPTESIDDGNGLISTGLSRPGNSDAGHPGNAHGSGTNHGSPSGADKGFTSPFCRVTDLGANPEEEKRLDVNCGDPATGGQGPLISTAVLAQQVANQL